MPTVGVVLINWNAGEFTVPCIKSLLAGIVKPDNIVVVDNASADSSADIIAASYPEVKIIRNSINKGYAGGNNDGIKYLLEQRIDYVWILNNDTVVADKCLSTLINVAGQHLHAAGFSAKIFYNDPPDRLWYAGAYRHPWHLAVAHYSDPRLDATAVRGVASVPFISGCCMFIPSWAWSKYGGFNESYFAYSEDNEWCWRVTLSGDKLYYVPEAVLWHRLSSSIKKNIGCEYNSSISPLAIYLMYRNQLWTVRRHAHGIFKWVALGLNIAIVFKNALLAILQKKSSDVRSYTKGLIDGLFAH